MAQVEGTVSQIYIDRMYCHEVTSPQAFDGLRKRGIGCLRPRRIVCFADHNIPTLHQEQPIADPVSRNQVEQLEKNARDFGLTCYGVQHPFNGIVHVAGPELGLTLPGMTVVCGDSHTSTHGALGAVAFGIGTSEVEEVLASQTLLQSKPHTMRINIEGAMPRGVTAKDVALYLISQMSVDGGTGYFVEYAGTTVRRMSMEERLTLCNLTIEMGARGGLVAPDETTFAYLRDREYTPRGMMWEQSIAAWRELATDADAQFDKEMTFDISHLTPMITYGTNPGMGMGIAGTIPMLDRAEPMQRASLEAALDYMGFQEGQQLLGHPIDWVFVGSCTNGRIEDFRAFASVVRGHRKAGNVTVWLVPGSQQVLKALHDEGIDHILEKAGFALREPGCSACLALNDDKVPAGKYALSTTNRNFRGRQGPGSRTLLCSPLTAAAAAITGHITNPLDFI